MKRVLTLAVVCALAVCLPVLASETAKVEKSDKMTATGKITGWNAETKTFTVQDKDGKSWTFQWNDSTKVQGTPKVGEMVRLAYMKDDKGVAWATKIEMMAMPASTEP